jgi:hypothetical protein
MLLSNLAFKFNLRRYTQAADFDQPLAAWNTSVGRCRLTVSKPELKARLASTLETEI